jgi:hypothetical protein
MTCYIKNIKEQLRLVVYLTSRQGPERSVKERI